jgi:RNA polymerase sigma-70 factor, ECF subfamily
MADPRAMAGAFLAALAPELRARFGDDASVGETLCALYTAARPTYPAVDVEPTAFAAEIGRRLDAETGPDRLARLRADHLYLAIACMNGDEAAIRAFEPLLDEVDASARRLRANDHADDVKARIREVLFVSAPGREAALRSYSGRGDLGSYIRVIATRDLVRAVDKGLRQVQLDDDVVMERLAPAGDPELGFLREAYRADVTAAMRVAVAGLDEPSRALLRYSLVDGWSVERIAALYGVHRATAGRRIRAVRDALGAAIRVEVARRLAISLADVDSIVRLVQSRIDVSIERLLE